MLPPTVLYMWPADRRFEGCWLVNSAPKQYELVPRPAYLRAASIVRLLYTTRGALANNRLLRLYFLLAAE